MTNEREEGGQSLVEVVVSVALIFTAVVALLALATTSLKGTGFSTNKAKATKLANEEMELIRSYRDSVYWSVFWEAVTDTTDCTTGSSCYIEVTDGGNLLSLGTDGPESVDVFSRYFTVADVSGGDNDSLRVTARVTWLSRGEEQEVTVSSVLTDWQ